jgi:hypothetical protein
MAASYACIEIFACMEESFAVHVRVWRRVLCVSGGEFCICACMAESFEKIADTLRSERKLIIEKEAREGGKSEPQKDLPRACSAPHSLGESCICFQD